MDTGFMPFIVGIVLIVTIGVVNIVNRAIEYRERVAMLQRGFVPKGYQPINPAATQPSQPVSPSALPPAPWNAQQWREGVPTSRYVGELAKDDANQR
ncbi:MAG: hypothetical protein DLM69_04405 [Candidatus Chloroheliales bacterium]|nr:MAG: hypothetical protein DLM69_04405 [Chloroflexota bacterium]